MRAWSVIAVTLFAIPVAADTLVLRGGRRIAGQLEGYRYDQVEWRDTRGRVERYDRDDVRSIELSDDDTVYEEGGGRDGDKSGMREREISVDARQDWTATGVRVKSGQRVFFEARGQVQWGPGRKDGPGGEGGSPRNANRPIPNRPAAALIGRIDNGDPFLIGDEEDSIRMPDGGTLYLGVNDDYRQDNSGSFRVTVYY